NACSGVNASSGAKGAPDAVRRRTMSASASSGRRGERLAGEPLSWLDTADGRYLVHTKTGEAGELTAEYVPAGRADLARAIREAIAAVY
ncbi:ESX secretion-associated protein EspG, partial [Amycolatopsis sp. NPDC051114]|uniref:ESX secretion-associated protein EspG n=1 Tax=Amycolatopsis sp. NPDC051114 TaxID=3155280 RepID=UPI003436E828